MSCHVKQLSLDTRCILRYFNKYVFIYNDGTNNSTVLILIYFSELDLYLTQGVLKVFL